MADKIPDHEVEYVNDKQELNKLFDLKIREELLEIKASDHNDVFEFADLYEVLMAFAANNGYTLSDITEAVLQKRLERGTFNFVVLNTLNPNNPSNKLYFDELIDERS